MMIANSFRQYQEYLRERKHAFPPNAFALGTAESPSELLSERLPARSY
jgi:hypothetical protein